MPGGRLKSSGPRRVLVIVHASAWAGGIVAWLRMMLALNRLTREFPGLKGVNRLRFTLAWVAFRDAVPLRPNRDR